MATKQTYQIKQKTETLKEPRQPLAESSFGAATSSSTSNESQEPKTGLNEVSKSQETASPPIVRRLKYEMCKNWREKGNCKYGDKCLFAHGEAELTKRTSAPQTESKE